MVWQPARHDLVWIAQDVRKSLVVEAIGESGFWPQEELDKLAHDGFEGTSVPGIVSRQPECADGLVIGLSSPYRKEGMRLRARAVIDYGCVESVQNPFELAALLHRAAEPGLPVAAAAKKAVAAAQDHGLECGIFGSYALQLVTGLPYCHEGSDLDLVVNLAERNALDGFYQTVSAMRETLGVSADVELLLPGGWGVKLAELFDDGCTVLAKGFNDVRLFKKDEVFAMDHRFSFERKENKNGSQV